MRDRRGQDEFDRALRHALSELPPMFRDALTNVAVVVEECPPDDLLAELGVRHAARACGGLVPCPFCPPRPPSQSSVSFFLLSAPKPSPSPGGPSSRIFRN